jgi:hypothetical protein
MTEPTLPKEWIEAHRRATRPAPDRRGCPDAEALAVLVVDPALAEASVLEHIEHCSACSRELERASDDGSLADLVAALVKDRTPDVSSGLQSDSEDRSMSRRWRSGALGGLALAASLVMALAIGLMLRPLDAPPTLRSGPQVEGLQPASGARLDQPPPRFEWPAGGGSEQLVLMDARAEIVWTAPAVREGWATVPSELQDSLPDGRYYWQVRDLERDALLGPFEFELTRP